MKTRRSFLRTAGAAALASGSLVRSAAPGRPNVIVILTDDQGYGDFSCHGNPVLKTPAMDRLHGESVRFTDFHSSPMCTPTRGQLLSGQDALRNGATSVTAGRALLRRGIPTMGDIFSANGYATGLFGKWHLGDYYPYRPMDRGFQEAKYFFGFGMSSAPEFDNDYFDGGYLDKGVRKRFSGYCTDFWFDEARKWIGEQKRKNQPFLVYLPTNAAHGPAWVDERYSAPYQRPKVPAAFFGMIANLDENLAKFDAFLTESGLRDNTILVFMTDNGGTGGVPLFNSGMRGRKTMYYEGGHRVPCFVRWPAGNLGAARDISAPSQMQDVLPTLVDLCGLKQTRNAQFDGASLAGLLKGTAKSLPDRMLVVQYGQIPKKWESCIIWNKWRAVNGEELYNLQDDPGQSKDVAAQHRDVLNKMRDYYEGWWAQREPGLREFCPISIGAPQENPVTLCSSDWEEVYADNPRNVLEAAGGPRGGPWSILVERDGEYEFALRRWHPAIDVPLNAACPEQKKRRGTLPEGKSLPIARAQLVVAGLEKSVQTAPADREARFRVKLKKGKTQLHGWFQDAAGKDLCGAFYATAKFIS